MKFEHIRFTIHENPRKAGDYGIGVITLNRPEVLNAISPLMRTELDALYTELAHSSEVKVVVITGAGRAFTSGGDVKSESEQLEGGDSSEGGMGIHGPYREMVEHYFNDVRHQILHQGMRKLEDLPQPTIAAVNGWAVGAGLELASNCDIRIASDRAKFAELAVPAGFVTEAGGTRNLPKLLGKGRALELILTGRRVDAQEALDIGLVERVVPHHELLEHVLDFAGQIAANPFLSVRKAKELVNMWWTFERTQERVDREYQAIIEVCRTQDCDEGMQAFMEKRAPDYRGPHYKQYYDGWLPDQSDPRIDGDGKGEGS